MCPQSSQAASQICCSKPIVAAFCLDAFAFAICLSFAECCRAGNVPSAHSPPLSVVGHQKAFPYIRTQNSARWKPVDKAPYRAPSVHHGPGGILLQLHSTSKASPLSNIRASRSGLSCATYCTPASSRSCPASFLSCRGLRSPAAHRCLRSPAANLPRCQKNREAFS